MKFFVFAVVSALLVAGGNADSLTTGSLGSGLPKKTIGAGIRIRGIVMESRAEGAIVRAEIPGAARTKTGWSKFPIAGDLFIRGSREKFFVNVIAREDG